MHSSFLTDLTVVLGVAGIICALAQTFRIPLILGYLFAGLLIGPYIPVPLFADTSRVESLAEFGVVFVMFCIGLEFQIKRLVKVVPTAGLTALMQISMLFGLGYIMGLMWEWSIVESIFLGGSIAISSTMVVSKVLDSSPKTSAREHIFGVLVLQDLAAVILIAALTAVAAGAGLSASEVGRTLAELTGVLAVMVIGGYLTIPRLIVYVEKLNNKEALTIVACGICFAMAFAAEKFGYSVALGAFVAGILVSESGHGPKIEHLLLEVKNIFAAIFFVSIGMTVDPLMAIKHLPTALTVAVVVIAGQFLFVTFAGLLSGIGLRKSVTTAIALGQIGEFAFIIATVGMSAGVVKTPLQSILVTVAIITTFTTPFFFNRIESIVGFVDRKMPSRVRLMLTFYESWLERLRVSAASGSRKAIIRKILIVILADIAIAVLIAVVFAIFRWRLEDTLHGLGLSATVRNLVLAVSLILLLAPPIWGIVKNLLKLSNFASTLLFKAENIKSPLLLRRIMIGPVAGFVAFPFFLLLSGLFESVLILEVFLLMILIGAIRFWRSTKGFQEDVHTGAKTFVELLARNQGETENMEQRETQIPGLHRVIDFKIPQSSRLQGKTLAEVNLRALTGCTVISIMRDGDEVILPTGREILAGGDMLVLAGTTSAAENAQKLLNDS